MVVVTVMVALVPIVLIVEVASVTVHAALAPSCSFAVHALFHPYLSFVH